MKTITAELMRALVGSGLAGAVLAALILLAALLLRGCVWGPTAPVPAPGALPGEVSTLAPSAPLAGAVEPRAATVARPDTTAPGGWRLEEVAYQPSAGAELAGALTVPADTVATVLLVERARVGLLAGRAWDAPRVVVRTADGTDATAVFVPHRRPFLAFGLHPAVGAGVSLAGEPAWWAGLELVDVGPVGLGLFAVATLGEDGLALRPAAGAGVALWDGLRLVAVAGPDVVGAGVAFRFGR